MDITVSSEAEIAEFIEGSSVLVVIVSYKSGELVVNAIESLKSELVNLPNMKVVVVDNTSGNDKPVIESAINTNNWQSWVTVVASPSNGGFSFGNNIAIRPALSADQPPEYIWLLNPDTQIYPEAGLELVKFLNNNTNVGIAGSCLFNDDGNEWGLRVSFSYNHE